MREEIINALLPFNKPISFKELSSLVNNQMTYDEQNLFINLLNELIRERIVEYSLHSGYLLNMRNLLRFKEDSCIMN
jgi:hypothetical protein